MLFARKHNEYGCPMCGSYASRQWKQLIDEYKREDTK